MASEPPPLRLKSVIYQRELPEIKHVGLLGTIYHRRLVQLAGFDDVLFMDSSGRVAEGATWKIGFIEGDRLVWPQASRLPGVTMRRVTDCATELGIRSSTETVGRADLRRMRAAFITNAAVGVRSVAAIDGVPFDPMSDMIRQLRDAYTAVRGELV